jgi:putative transcriptional regulator
MADSTLGRLLVATPKLTDPNFSRTVVYICAHDENGAFGIVLNRPLPELPAEEHVPRWSRFLAGPRVLFSGGPVERTVAVALARSPDPAGASCLRPVAGEIAMVDLSFPGDEVIAEVACMRVFAGYSGWGAGQLDGEIEQDAWFVVDADPADIFTDEPDGLWRRVVQRQPGKVAMFAFSPDDPRLN